ncbi:MAG: formate dehydrogenase accessory protein FdhE [Thermodesulfobacteriota bacterium]
MEKLKKRIQQLKKKRPGYKEILDFYQKIRDEQEKTKASLKLEPIHLRKEWKALLTKEGFPILEKGDFPVDIEASMTLFHSLCQIGKDANSHMAREAEKIEAILDQKKVDLKRLLIEGTKEGKIKEIGREFGLDKQVLTYLVQESLRPSIEAGVEKLHHEFDTRNWLKGYCPICGSLPYLSLLKEEVGKRYLLCSFCGYAWRVDRMTCPFCQNKGQESLHYFYGEGEEALRIDFCDKCREYIKTIDLRKIDSDDPTLEDLATLHLDVLASQKGYRRPIARLFAT